MTVFSSWLPPHLSRHVTPLLLLRPLSCCESRQAVVQVLGPAAVKLCQWLSYGNLLSTLPAAGCVKELATAAGSALKAIAAQPPTPHLRHQSEGAARRLVVTKLAAAQQVLAGPAWSAKTSSSECCYSSWQHSQHILALLPIQAHMATAANSLSGKPSLKYVSCQHVQRSAAALFGGFVRGCVY